MNTITSKVISLPNNKEVLPTEYQELLSRLEIDNKRYKEKRDELTSVLNDLNIKLTINDKLIEVLRKSLFDE